MLDLAGVDLHPAEALSEIQAGMADRNAGVPSADRIDFKKLHGAAENHRVAVRNIRRDGNDAIKRAMKDKKITEDDEKKALEEIQRLTDDEIKKMEEMAKAKEKEVMEIK